MQVHKQTTESCGNVEKQKQLSHFPTAFSLSLPNNRRAGFALRPPRGTFYSARLGIFLFGFDIRQARVVAHENIEVQ